MPETKPVAVTAEDIITKLDEVTAGLSDNQRGEVREEVEKIVADEVKDKIGPMVEEKLRTVMAERAYKPEADTDFGNDRSMIAGTEWANMRDVQDKPMTPGGLALCHDILLAGMQFGKKGPSEKLRNFVADARARSLDTAETGFGAELTPDVLYVPQLWADARINYGNIVGLVESRRMTGPTEKQPILAAIPQMIFVGETTDNLGSATQYGTQKVGSNEVTLTAKKLLANYQYSGELLEDAIVPLASVLQQALARALAKTSDSLLLNGDTTNAATGNINLDDADPTDTLYYLAADGIRHAALVDNTANTVNAGGVAMTYRMLTNLPTLMLDRTYDTHWGREGQVYYVGTPELDDDVLDLDEIVNSAAYVGQRPEYTPVRGQLTTIAGKPYISTPAMPLTEADGKVSTTAGNNTLGQVVCFNPMGLLWGVRRETKIEVEREARWDMWAIVMTTRVAVGRASPTGAASGIEWAACLRNILDS